MSCKSPLGNIEYAIVFYVYENKPFSSCKLHTISDFPIQMGSSDKLWLFEFANTPNGWQCAFCRSNQNKVNRTMSVVVITGLLICGTDTVDVHLTICKPFKSWIDGINFKFIRFSLQFYFLIELIFRYSLQTGNERNMSKDFDRVSLTII